MEFRISPFIIIIGVNLSKLHGLFTRMLTVSICVCAVHFAMYCEKCTLHVEHVQAVGLGVDRAVSHIPRHIQGKACDCV